MKESVQINSKIEFRVENGLMSSENLAHNDLAFLKNNFCKSKHISVEYLKSEKREFM